MAWSEAAHKASAEARKAAARNHLQTVGIKGRAAQDRVLAAAPTRFAPSAKMTLLRAVQAFSPQALRGMSKPPSGQPKSWHATHRTAKAKKKGWI